MNIVNLGVGLAPDVYVTDGHVYVAYGQQTPTALILVLLDNTGHELSRKTIPSGFFNSFPRFGGPWLAFKRGDPTYGPAMINVVNGHVQTWPGVAAGNYGLAVNPFEGLVAYQNGSYPIWFGDFGGGAGDSGLQGAPDGLDTLVSRAQVTLRKDTRTSVPGIDYPVNAADLTVGEWYTSPYGLGVILQGDALRVALEGQDCPTPRCATDGTTYALVTGGPSGVRLWLGSRADVQALPLASSFTPPQPDAPIGPRSDPRAADGRLYDVRAFLTTDQALQPRKGPTHPQHQLQPDADGVFCLVKFGDIIPTGRAYEMYRWDAGGLRHLEDASGSTPMHFTDTRWWPAKMAIGEAHAFVTGEHLSVWDERDPCRETHRDPVNRKMWLHAVYDAWYWGQDLGTRATAMLVYDNTAGFHTSGRFVEVGYYAVGAGWCRWEAYHAEQVYAHGAAQFPPEAMSSRSDFYLVGGPVMTPELTGCVDPLAPTGQPWDTTPTPVPDIGGFVIDPKEIILYKAQKPSVRAGCVTLINQDDTVVSIQPDGSRQTRPAGTDGPYEQAQVTGTIAAYAPGGQPYAFGCAPIDKVL